MRISKDLSLNFKEELPERKNQKPAEIEIKGFISFDL